MIAQNLITQTNFRNSFYENSSYKDSVDKKSQSR